MKLSREWTKAPSELARSVKSPSNPDALRLGQFPRCASPAKSVKNIAKRFTPNVKSLKTF
jgi:hypothetical protein